MDFVSHLRWRPEIGDPTLMGWLTVVAYFVGAVLAGCAAVAHARTGGESGTRRRNTRLWLTVVAAMTCLGVNKQFDLQSLATDIGRVIARHQGWYEHRRGLQEWFVAGLLIGVAVLACWSTWRHAAFWRSHKLLGTGVFFLGTFVVVRAISFHHVDAFLGSRVFGFKANCSLELSGILLIGIAAARECVLRR